MLAQPVKRAGAGRAGKQFLSDSTDENGLSVVNQLLQGEYKDPLGR